MMKRFYIFLAVFEVLSFLLLLLYYPNTLVNMEGNDLFLFTSDYIGGVLSEGQGVSGLIQYFMLQFFSTAWMGALIYSLVLTLSTLFLCLTLANLKKANLYWLTFVPAMLIFAFSFPIVEMSLNYMFFALLLYLFTAIKSTVGRVIYAVLLPIPAFCLITWFESALLFASFAIVELLFYRKKASAAIMLLPFVASFFIPRLWSGFVEFIPFSQRPLTGFSSFFTTQIMAAYVLTAFVVIIPIELKIKKFVGLCVTPLLFAGFVAISLSDKDLRFDERSIKISFMADAKDWSGILAEIPYEEAVTSKVLTAYTLLAMNATGNMAENLFAYPINTPEMFLFRHNQKPFYTNFNRLFYDNIGIWDEAFHQAFEYGVTQAGNDCFKAMRFKTDYALNSNDLGVARYYLNLLARSCNNSEFVKTRLSRLAQLEANKKNIKLPPYRSDTFTGAYPMASEMFRLFERNKSSKKLLDYVLCSLLLNKEVDKFGIILANFNLYKGEKLPRAYSEAMAALASRDPNARTIAEYDPTFDNYYADFMNRVAQKQNIGEYSTTYWAYLVYRQTASQIENNE